MAERGAEQAQHDPDRPPRVVIIMGWYLKFATEEDAEVVYGIVQAAFAEYQETVPVTPGALKETMEDTRRIVAEGQTILICYLDDSLAHADLPRWNGEFEDSYIEALRAELKAAPPVGTVRYELRQDHLYVGRLAVLPGWRRRGVGRILMEYVEKLGPPLGLTRIRLGTRESMPSNLAFYEKLGYRVVEREPHSRGPDVILWFEKELIDADTPATLLNGVVDGLNPVLGSALEAVTYWCLDSEAGIDIDAPSIYFGAEAELKFEGVGSLYVTWGNNKGWGGDYSLRVLNESAFNQATLVPFDATSTKIWKSFAGTPLRAADILGWEGVPYLARLNFDGGAAYIGIGYQYGFGDGDDVIVCSEEGWQSLWRDFNGDQPAVLAHVVASQGSEGSAGS